MIFPELSDKELEILEVLAEPDDDLGMKAKRIAYELRGFADDSRRKSYPDGHLISREIRSLHERNLIEEAGRGINPRKWRITPRGESVLNRRSP